MTERTSPDQAAQPSPNGLLDPSRTASAEIGFNYGYGRINLINGLQPMSTVSVVHDDGERSDYAVAADITTPGRNDGDGERFLIAVDQPADGGPVEGVFAIKVNHIIPGQEGKQDTVMADSDPEVTDWDGTRSFRFGDTTISLKQRKEHAEEETVLEVSSFHTKTVNIKVAEASHPVKARRLDRAEAKQEKRHDRLRKVAKVAGLLFAARSILLPGGLIDDIMDPFHDASAAVDDKKWDDVDPRGGLDGVSFSDHPDMLAEEQELVDQHNAAVQRLGDVLGALDNHDYDSLHEMADGYLAQNEGQFMPAGRLENINANINSATSAGDVMIALNAFTDFYEKNVSFYDPEGNTYKNFDRLSADSANVEDLKRTARYIIEAYQNLPQGLLSSARFDTILLAGGGNMMEGLGGTQAFYQDYDNSLVIRVDSAGTRRANSVHDLTSPNRIESTDPTRFILHETGHADDPELAYDEDAGIERIDFTPSFLLTSLVGHQNRASWYGASSGRAENVADNFANTLSTNMINHPDFVRFFTSEASQDEIDLLLSLEEQYPGFTAHLYEAKLPNDHHDRDQTRDILIVGLLAAFPLKPKRR